MGLKILTKTQREQIAYPENPDGLQLRCAVGLINGVFTEVVFAGIYKAGKIQEGSFAWNGNGFDVDGVAEEDKSEVERLCNELAYALADAYGFTITEIAEQEPVPPTDTEEV